MENFLSNDKDDAPSLTCFHSTLSIISAPGALLSVIGGRSNEIYCETKLTEKTQNYSFRSAIKTSIALYDVRMNGNAAKLCV